MNAFGKALVVFSSTCALGAFAWGVRAALGSPLFTLQAIEVNVPEIPAPQARAAQRPTSLGVDAQAISDLAGIPIGKTNLFSLDLSQIEARLLKDPWIKAVRLEKHFPQTLSISVTFKTPRALGQGPSGALAYIDADGNPFGKVSLLQNADLPLFTGMDSRSRMTEALRWLGAWESAPVGRYAQVASITWEPERGFRALVTYASRSGGEASRAPTAVPGRPASGLTAHTMLDLGQEIDADPSSQLRQVNEVLRYLSDNSIGARQIWADTAKKIVVKTTHGS